MKGEGGKRTTTPQRFRETFLKKVPRQTAIKLPLCSRKGRKERDFRAATSRNGVGAHREVTVEFPIVGAERKVGRRTELGEREVVRKGAVEW